MSISERDQQALDLIEEDLAGSVPELAAKLAVFTRLTADEAMPPRERVWHRARTPAARLASATAAAASARPARPASPAEAAVGRRTARGWRWLRRRTVWQLMALILALALLALTFVAGHGTGQGACPVTGLATCRQAPAHAPAPGRPGAGAGAGAISHG